MLADSADPVEVIAAMGTAPKAALTAAFTAAKADAATPKPAAQISEITGKAKPKSAAGTIGGLTQPAKSPALAIPPFTGLAAIADARAGSGVVSPLRGLPPNMHRVATLEALQPRIVYRCELSNVAGRAYAFKGPVRPLSSLSEVCVPPHGARIGVVLETLEFRYEHFRTGLPAGALVPLVVNEDGPPVGTPPYAVYVRPSTSAAAASASFATPSAGTAMASQTRDDRRFADALTRIATDSACTPDFATTTKAAVAVLDVDSTLAAMQALALPAKIAYGTVVKPQPLTKTQACYKVEAAITVDTVTHTAAASKYTLQADGITLKRSSDLQSEEFGRAYFLVGRHLGAKAIVMGVSQTLMANTGGMLLAAFQGHLVPSLAEYTASTNLYAGCVYAARHLFTTPVSAYGECETRLVCVFARAELEACLGMDSATLRAKVNSYAAAEVILVPQALTEILAHTEAYEGVVQFLDILYFSSALSTGATGHACSTDGQRLTGPVLATVATMPPSAISSCGDLSALFSKALDMADPLADYAAAGLAGTGKAIGALSATVSPAAAAAPKALAATRTLQLATLKQQQSGRVAQSHAVEERKQALISAGSAYVLEVYGVVHSAPRFGTLVALAPYYATAEAVSDPSAFHFLRCEYSGFITKRFSSLKSGQGVAGAKALVAITEQLPADVTDALATDQSAAVNRIKTLLNRYGLSLSEASAFLSSKGQEAATAITAIGREEAAASAAATLMAYCEKHGVELTVLESPALQQLASRGVVDPVHPDRTTELIKTRQKPQLIAAALRSGLRSVVGSAIDVLVQAVESVAPGADSAACSKAVALAQDVAVVISPALTAGKITKDVATALGAYPTAIQNAAAEVVTRTGNTGIAALKAPVDTTDFL